MGGDFSKPTTWEILNNTFPISIKWYLMLILPIILISYLCIKIFKLGYVKWKILFFVVIFGFISMLASTFSTAYFEGSLIPRILIFAIIFLILGVFEIITLKKYLSEIKIFQRASFVLLANFPVIFIYYLIVF